MMKINFICFVNIFSCVITLFELYSFWNKKKVHRICTIIVGVCSIICAIPLKSWLLVICELYVIINTIVVLVKYDIKIVED